LLTLKYCTGIKQVAVVGGRTSSEEDERVRWFLLRVQEIGGEVREVRLNYNFTTMDALKEYFLKPLRSVHFRSLSIANVGCKESPPPMKQVVECEERQVSISTEDYIRLYVARHLSWHTVSFWE
jgi:hypothetical protein